jgi:hypothetical protein
MPDDFPGGTTAQHIDIVDTVAANHHRMHQRQHLATWASRPRPVAQIDELVRQCLDPEGLSEHRHQAEPGVSDGMIVVEDHVQTRRIVQRCLHHKGASL